jgi:hypothetical protein
MEARSEIVKQGLRKAYTAKVPERNLNVFCVSSKAYEKYSRKGQADYVQKSGIPELRRFCHSVTATGQLMEAKHYMTSSLPGFLSSIKMWLEGRIVDSQSSKPEYDSAYLFEDLAIMRKEVRKFS